MWGISVIDPTITVGNIIEIGVLLVGGIAVVIRTGGDIRVMRNEMGHLTTQVTTLNTAFESLRSVLTQVAVQDTRIVAMEKRIDELSHGRGFIQHEIQGEWPHP